MTTATAVHPSWYTDEDDTTWEKVKAAFRRDWKQTKHNMGANEPDLNQHVDDTIGQATGSQPIPPGNAPTPQPDSDDSYNETDEPAYRYGYAASRHYAEWSLDTEKMLQNDWDDQQEWLRQREAVHRGWRYYRENSNPGAFKTV